MKLVSILAATASFMVLAATAAPAAQIRYSAELKGADEVPANDSKGKGKVEATLDDETGVLAYKITYSGLSGPATMAHFHGPAAPGNNAPPIVTAKGVTSPITGSETLTADQMSDLAAGRWYFNVHTKAHASGEIRGQLMAKDKKSAASNMVCPFGQCIEPKAGPAM